MKKLILVPLAVLTVLGLTALSAMPYFEATRDMAVATAGSTVTLGPVTTTSSSYFIPFGYVRLTCTSPTYYSVNASSATAATTSSSLAPGAITVNNVTLTRSIWLNVSSGTQYLALLLKGGVQGTCIAEQVSVDGTAGSFTTLAASSTLAVTGATTLASTAYIQGATTVDGALRSGGTISGTFDGGTAVLGATSAASLDLPSSTQLTGIKFGTITLGGQSPSTGTATVLSGMKCNCTANDAAADNALKCAVSSTTLTATGPNLSTGTVNYFCWK